VHVQSVNISPVRKVEHNGRTVSTGIYKAPVAGPVCVRTLGLEGDGQAEACHGGPDMAVYAFTCENYDHWAAVLERSDLHPGKFGENLTVTGMPESEVCVGDRFRIGGVELEVSLPRAPCSKLAMAVGDVGFPKVFLATCRVGFYLRVRREGTLQAGDAVERIHADPARLSIQEVTRLMYFDTDNKEGASRAAAVEALTKSWRTKFHSRTA
jgi:MOSC domain-containing protein YiiM